MPEQVNRRGSLVILGTGIKIVGQLTVEAIARIKGADLVLYLVGDSLAEAILRGMNPGRCETLAGYYAGGKPRIDTYHEMAGRILESVRSGLEVCVVAYGHPGVYTYPTHEAISRARSEGYEALMLPGISAEDCLYADLGLDPASSGCLSFEATDFLLHNYRVDPAWLLILWQVGIVGVSDKPSDGAEVFALPLLVERLLETYPAEHPVILYQAAIFFWQRPYIRTVPLRDLAVSEVPGMSTLCIPPAVKSPIDLEMLARLEAIRRSSRNPRRMDPSPVTGEDEETAGGGP